MGKLAQLGNHLRQVHQVVNRPVSACQLLRIRGVQDQQHVEAATSVRRMDVCEDEPGREVAAAIKGPLWGR